MMRYSRMTPFQRRLLGLTCSFECAITIQSELAGLGACTISKLLSRPCYPSMLTLILLADYYDVSLDYLCCRTDIRE